MTSERGPSQGRQSHLRHMTRGKDGKAQTTPWTSSRAAQVPGPNLPDLVEDFSTNA